MTLLKLVEVLRSEAGPSWAHVFTEDEVTDALRKAKHDLSLTAHVQIPNHMMMGVVSKAAVHLNHLDPERMAEALEKDQPDGPHAPA